MRDIGLHIIDISENSAKANAENIEIKIKIKENELILTITDDGDGMDKDALDNAFNPFYTKNKSREVGLGLPLLKNSAEKTGGYAKIKSELKKGTAVKALFNLNSVNAIPLGNLAEDFCILMITNPQCDFCFKIEKGNESFIFEEKRVKEILGINEIPLSMKKETEKYLREKISDLF